MVVSRLFFSAFFISLLMFAVITETRAVDYELPDTDGKMQSLDQYKGEWLIVNYWATWCALCMEELPELVDFHKNNKVGATVVGINFEEIETKDLKEFVDRASIPYAVLRTVPVRKTPLGSVPALPTTYIIDPDGNVVAAQVGFVTRKNLEAYIAQKEG